MMDYRVEEISLEERALERQVEDLIGEAFGMQLPVGRVRRNTAAPGLKTPLYVAALRDQEVIGFNAFIAHDLTLNGQQIAAFQSCWTATSAAHRGKKIFQNLILAAQEILGGRGAAFIFGFPNEASHPIFIHKLGYRQISPVKWQMPYLGLARPFWFNRSEARLSEMHHNVILQNDRELIHLKRNEPEPRVEVFEYDGSLCWGVRRERTLGGFTIGYLDIGGISLVDTRHMPILVWGLLGRIRSVAFAQLVGTEGAPYNGLLRRIAPSRSNVLIIKDLNLETRGLSFNLFGGVRDVY